MTFKVQFKQMKLAAILSPNRIKEVAFNQTRYSQHTPPSTLGLRVLQLNLLEKCWERGDGEQGVRELAHGGL